MSRYATRKELAEKAEWEGGTLDFLFGYGVDEADLPEGDTEILDLVREIKAVMPAVDALNFLLDEALEEESD